MFYFYSASLTFYIFLPLLGAVLAGLFGRFFGRAGTAWLVVVGLAFTLGGLIFHGLPGVGLGQSEWVRGGEWILLGVGWGFLFDPFTIEMSLLISVITLCVLLYASEYMFHDPHPIRFLALLSLFAFFMLLLVTSANLVQLFIGWEGVGTVSYLLINFWFTRLEANRSALKALLFNRIGDSFFLLGLLLLWFSLRSTDLPLITTLFAATSSSVFARVPDLTLVCFALAAAGKSAQLGLHAWLPDAMEGPTPVSSLLHSATMVTAGVFLLARLSPLLSPSSSFLYFLTGLGALTALVSALIALYQMDLKKVIAFSTCSQLGLMVVAVTYHAPLGFYHLLNHGFFKALLFLSAGAVIHALGGEQDLRRMGGLLNYMPFTALCFLVGGLALAGFPFLSGFYSKEFILFHLFVFGSTGAAFLFLALFLTSLCTLLYALKLVRIVFYTPRYRALFPLSQVHEPAWTMLVPMLILGIFAVVFGWLEEEILLGFGTARWSTTLSSPFNFFYTDLFVATETSSFPWKLLLPVLTLIVLFRSLHKPVFATRGRWSFLTLSTGSIPVWGWWVVVHRLGFLSLYRILARSSLVIAYRTLFRLFDRGVFELIGPLVAVRLVRQARRQYFVSVSIPLTVLSGWLVLCGLGGWALLSPLYAPLLLLLLPFVVRLYLRSTFFATVA